MRSDHFIIGAWIFTAPNVPEQAAQILAGIFLVIAIIATIIEIVKK